MVLGLSTSASAAPSVMVPTGVQEAYPSGPYYQPTKDLGNGMLYRSVVIRLDTDGIYIHTNAAHYDFGIKKISIAYDGYLHIWSDEAPIASVQCQADESIGAERGIIAGASGGGGHTVIRLRDTRIDRVLDLYSTSDYSRVASEYSNLWCQWMLVDPSKL